MGISMSLSVSLFFKVVIVLFYSRSRRMATKRTKRTETPTSYFYCVCLIHKVAFDICVISIMKIKLTTSIISLCTHLIVGMLWFCLGVNPKVVNVCGSVSFPIPRPFLVYIDCLSFLLLLHESWRWGRERERERRGEEGCICMCLLK